MNKCNMGSTATIVYRNVSHSPMLAGSGTCRLGEWLCAVPVSLGLCRGSKSPEWLWARARAMSRIMWSLWRQLIENMKAAAVPARSVPERGSPGQPCCFSEFSSQLSCRRFWLVVLCTCKGFANGSGFNGQTQILCEDGQGAIQPLALHAGGMPHLAVLSITPKHD